MNCSHLLRYLVLPCFFATTFFACNTNGLYHVKSQRLRDNIDYGWGYLYNGGILQIYDLSDTGFKFKIKPLGKHYRDSDTFCFSALFVDDSTGESEKLFFDGSKRIYSRLILHIKTDNSVFVELAGKDKWFLYETLLTPFIKEFVPRDNLPSLSFLDAPLNYKLKRKAGERIWDFINCFKKYDVHTTKDSSFSFKAYTGKADTMSKIFEAIVLVRSDTFFSAGLIINDTALSYSNDPIYGSFDCRSSFELDRWFAMHHIKPTYREFYNSYVDSLN